MNSVLHQDLRVCSIMASVSANTQFFRAAMTERRFNIVPGEHPITPIMIGDAALAGKMADRLLENGVYAIGFSFLVVPQGKARVRVQVSAAHTREDLEFAIDAFTKVRDELGLFSRSQGWSCLDRPDSVL
jgi:glycine C-acetyltransferase